MYHIILLLNISGHQTVNLHKSTSVVQHHKEKYGGNFPIWVIVEFFSMGMLSYFYFPLYIHLTVSRTFHDCAYHCK
ncbi:Abi family protein [Dorea hominis]|uniref:Abi family protein n=1 Tax=Dorea hominis TaxID=2763040 RepID=UPI001FAD434C|nr:Abi family protein [Dorea hominis]